MNNENLFGPKKRIQKKYEREMGQLIKKLTAAANKANSIEEMLSLFDVIAGSAAFKNWSDKVATDMVRSTLVSNADSWRAAASKGTRSRRIYELLKQRFGNSKEFNDLITKNAELIRTIPTTTAEKISKYAANAALAGKRPAVVLQELQKRAPKIAKYKAVRIARTETAKAQAAIVERQALDAGLTWYEWETAKDQRVRGSHKHMQGVLCSFKNPPSPEQLKGENPQGNYNPGNIWNCRCFAVPVVSLDFIQWPAKIDTGTAIRSLSRREFEKLK